MRKFNLPLSDSERRSLAAGENILISGELITARDAAHLRLLASLRNGETLPIDLTVASIYYAGPSPSAPGEIIGSIGPTTAGRMDPFMREFIEAGLRVTIGKGARNQETKDMMRKVGAVYLGAIGGAGARYATCVKSVRIIAYDELQSEAIRSMIVENFPVTVIIDAEGNDRYAYLTKQGE